jgi:general secretion pathway protein F
MPHFRYRALTNAGEMVVGEIDAPSRAEVVRRIEYLGHLPIEAEVASKSGLAGIGQGRARLRPGELTVFLRQLALLCGAGLTLEAALQTLGENASKGLTWFSGAIRSSISSGDSLGEALARHPAIIEPAYVAMIRAGEASGKLDVVLRAIVEDRSRREQLAERINSAIRYPLFLIASAAAILLFFLVYVVPQFESVFKDLGGRLNGGAAFVLAASGWLHANFDVFLATCLVLVLAAWLVFSKRSARMAVIAAAAAVPGVAGPMRDRRAARIIGTLGLLVENGVTLPTALKIVRDVVSEPRHVAAVDRLNEQVRSGRRFADALAETDLVPPLAVRMLRIGDETGDLASIATHAAQFYEQKFGVGLDRLMGAIGPVTIVIVSVVIGALIVSIMSALLSITELAI